MDENRDLEHYIYVCAMFFGLCVVLALTGCSTDQDPLDLHGKNLVYERTATTIDIELIFGRNMLGEEVCQIWDGIHGRHDAQ